MRRLKSLWRVGVATAAATALSGNVTSAFAGAGTLELSLTAKTPQVTYASPPGLKTWFVTQISLANKGNNTINDIAFKISLSATDAAEQFDIITSQVLPAGCIKTGTAEFTCQVRQMKRGTSFPDSPFTVAYTAPARVVNGVADADDTDFIKADVQVAYAEQFNGVPNSRPQNSVQTFTVDQLVRLGTNISDDVKSAVPKLEGTTPMFTGADGIPTSGNKLTERAEIPTLSIPYALSEIKIDDITADTRCTNLGHFFKCPQYLTTVQDGSLQDVQFANPASPLMTVYRIDASNLRMSTSKTLNSVQLLYTGGSFTDEPVPVCSNGVPNTGVKAGLPCVLAAQCFKKGTSGSQNGYCEWDLINIRNGTLKIL
jgi:hypothetical protein